MNNFFDIIFKDSFIYWHSINLFSRIECKIKKKIQKCLIAPRPVCKNPPLQPSMLCQFTPLPVGYDYECL